jgi:hypothetical protein
MVNTSNAARSPIVQRRLTVRIGERVEIIKRSGTA